MRTLRTRDGRVCGNAIIIGEVNPHPSAAEYLAKTRQKMWLIETDFGNLIRLSCREIDEFFFREDELDELQALHSKQRYQEWAQARAELTDPNRTRVDYPHDCEASLSS